ncbi:MAG: CvpA family protein [Oscillospiraceae bacterium]|jgi:hypothetical protein|nr:CvpA family protein [Oscillospiraceae bacterium]
MESNVTTNGGSKDYIIAPEKPGLKLALSLIATLIAAAIGYYLYLPAINPKSSQFWLYLAGVVISFVVFLTIFSGAAKKPEYSPYVRRKSFIPVILVGVIVIITLIGYLAGCALFRAKDYSQLLNVNNQTEADFSEDIQSVDVSSFTRLPRLDEDSARQLAPKALSALGDSGTVSQFTVYNTYTQINYKGRPVRVAPLQYASIIKWLSNTKNGLPGYVIINMADETTDFHKLDEDKYIRYSPAEHFSRLLKRHLRFNYPTYLFGESTFEIDDAGNPYWICPRLDNKLGLFGGTDVIGAVIVKADSKTGESIYYSIDELRDNKDLQWIDRIFDSNLLVKQFNFAGKYHSGFWNAIMTQKDVRAATDGHNYLALDDDVYLYTGVTSATSDQSIVGFVLINQRTKGANFYRVGGSTEQAAMASAEGRVSDLRYKATFPLLVNVGGQPTYFMSLKDTQNSNQIVQQYALINVKDYNKIGANAKSLDDVLRLYTEALTKNGVTPPPIITPDNNDNTTVTGTVTDIRTQLLSGESVYYIRLADNTAWYRISASVYEPVVLLSKGAKVTIVVEKKSEDADKAIVNIVEFKTGS